MSISWKFQYKRQFKWLQDTRWYLYRKISLGLQKRILELGCATALITEEIYRKHNKTVIGVDKDLDILMKAKKRERNLLLVCGDVYRLPFPDCVFDSTFFQYFLMWLKKPLPALNEMKRILASGGWLISAGEPDYGGRVDFPQSLSLTSLIIENLLSSEADPFVGRKLEYLFRNRSLTEIEWGLASQPSDLEFVKANLEEEWDFIEKIVGKKYSQKIKDKKIKEKEFISLNKRSYFTPVFYCIGKKT